MKNQKKLKQKIRKKIASGNLIQSDIKNDTEKYAQLEIRRAVIFIIFALVVLTLASTLLSDLSFAQRLRELLNISKITW